MNGFWLLRFFLWLKIRFELHKALMNDRDANLFIQKKNRFPKYSKALEVIASRSCTSQEEQDCVTRRPDRIQDWCSRCLALDVLIND